MTNKKLLFRTNLSVIILSLAACNNQLQDGSQSAENDGNTLSNILSSSVRSCEGEQAKSAVAKSIYSEFSSKDSSFVESMKSLELIFVYSSNTINILKTSNFDELGQGCFIDGDEFQVFTSSEECHDLRKKQNRDGELIYGNVKNIPNIKTVFSEFITISEQNVDGVLKCKIKFIVNQDSDTVDQFNRSTSWININLSVYDKKTSDGSFYTEYSFIDQNQNQNNQGTQYRRIQGQDLRTMTGGTGVRE